MAVAVIATVACEQIDNKQKPTEEAALRITVKAHPDEIKGEAETRTYINSADNTIYWGTGEYMKIGVFDGEATTWDKSADSSSDIWDGDTEALFEFSINPANASGDYTYFGLYPFSAAVTSNNTDPASYKVNLPSIQNATASSYDPKAYILVAKPESGKTETDSDWEASFRRATALNKITLSNLPEDIKRVTITAPLGTYLAGARHINLTTGQSGDIYNGGGKTETVEVKFANKQSHESPIVVWFTSWDAEIPVNGNLTIVAFSDAHTYTRTLTVVNKPISFKEGYLNTLNVNMATASVGTNTQLEEGNYVILAKNGESYYAVTAATNGNHIASTNYTGSTSSYLGDAELIWNITKVDDSYIFENTGKYIGYKNSSNEAFWLAPDEDWTETNYLMDLTWDGANSVYYVTLHSNSGRKFSRNSGSDYFAFYTSDQQKSIVFVPASVDPRTVVTLSFDEDIVGFTTANYDSFLGQDVMASPNVTDVTDHLSWSKVDNDSVIDDFDNGVLTLTGNEGTATVTVSFAGDANYRPAQASYTIEVSGAGSITLTDSEITAGSNTVKGTNSGKLAYRLGTSSADGSLTFDAGYSSITFTLAGWASGTRSFTITNGKIDDSTSLSPSAGTPSGNINAGFSTSYEGTEYTIIVDDPSEEVVFSGRRCVVWGFTAVEATPDTRAEASLAWKKGGVVADSDTASIEDADDVLPTITLDNPHSLSVSYASSNEGVATINSSTGVVSLVSAGETIISAIFEGNVDYTPSTVTYTLDVSDNRTPSANTVAEVLAGGAGTYQMANLLVYAVAGNQAIVGDATGKMILYKSGHGLSAGDNFSIPSATVAEYNGILQIQDGTFNKNSTGNAIDHGAAANLNDVGVSASVNTTFSASGYHAAAFVTMNGTQSDRSISGPNSVVLYMSQANNTYNGKPVSVTGYIYYYNSSFSNYNFQVVSIEEDESVPTISVSPSSLSWASDATDAKSLEVTLNGAAAVDDYTYEVTDGTVGDWNILDNNSGTITVSPKAANGSSESAKSLTIRIKHSDAPTTVYQDVICTQAKTNSSTLTTHLDETGFRNTINSSSHGYADDESTYSYDSATWLIRGNANSGGYWVQIRNNATASYVGVTAPGTISKVTVKISNATNSSGGQYDISKHGDFSGTISLTTSASGGYNDNKVGSTTTITDDIAEITPSGSNSTLYIKTSGAARIWDVVVTYTN